MQLIETLTSDPRDTLLNITAAKRCTDNSRKLKAATKASISSPCCFSHVTQLDRAEADDVMQFNSLTSPSTVI